MHRSTCIVRKLSRAARSALCIGIATAPLSASAAPIGLSTSYQQNFDVLAATGSKQPWVDDATIAGFYASRSTYNAGTGSSNAGALYSFGASGAAERALGSVASGSTGTIYYGLLLLNDTAQTIDRVQVSYRGEQWREAGSASSTPSVAQQLSFSYQVRAADLTSGTWTAFTDLDFVGPHLGASSPAALDGNAAANSTTLSATISGLALAPGQTLWLRWADQNDANNDHGLALDDLSISAVDLGGAGGSGGDDGSTPDCSAADVPIGAVQGTGESAAITGLVTLQGVVVGDYEGPSPALRGFYIQDQGDGDPASSDAIFVYHGDTDSVALGDEVQVTGTAGEFQGQTQLSGSLTIVKCGEGNTLAATPLSLPADPAELEAHEGMLVTFPDTLYVTEHYQLGRFGQVTLSVGDRLYQPTSLFVPGPQADALAALNARSSILLDDALQSQNPDPIVFGRGGQPLSASNTLRGGDKVSGLSGVLTYTWAGNAASGNAFRVRPQNALGAALPDFVAANPRPTHVTVTAPVRVASFNLLNYFDDFSACSFGVGGAPADCRGAEDAEEFARQQAKTVAAMRALGADIYGLIELENDGYGPDSALASLVGALNAAAGSAQYAFVDVDAQSGVTNAAGTDAIRVGLVYDSTRVQPVAGATLADADPVHNRAPIAQLFEDSAGGRFNVIVNHFKSKGCGAAAGADADQGDGQGCWNALRLQQANALERFVDLVVSASGDADVLLVGDFNAYAQEDPLRELRAFGYSDLALDAEGPRAYSYVFDGRWGSLDHGLASATLAQQLAGAQTFHINADEPSVLDYNTNFKSAAQLASLYAPDAYRTSDHDPLVIGLTPVARYAFEGFFGKLAQPAATQNANAALPIIFGLGGDFGSDVVFSAESRAVDCASGAASSGFTPISTKGASGLHYNPVSARYTLVWSPGRAAAGSCRELSLILADGSVHRASVRFR